MITRPDVDHVLQRRLAGYLKRAEMESDAPGDNEHLTDPLGWAMRLLGYSPALLADVTDDDLATVSMAHIDALLDLAELRTMESIVTNLDDVNITTGPIKTEWSALRSDLLKLLPERRKIVQAMWGHLLEVPLDGDAPTAVRLVAV